MNETLNKKETKQLPAWKLAQQAKSNVAQTIPSYAYNPLPKTPSRRDLHRMNVAMRRHAS